MKFPDRRVESGEMFHFMTRSGGRDLTVGGFCKRHIGRWYCVTCVQHVPRGQCRDHLNKKPLAGGEHRMLWDCKIHGPEGRRPAPAARRGFIRV